MHQAVGNPINSNALGRCNYFSLVSLPNIFTKCHNDVNL